MEEAYALALSGAAPFAGRVADAPLLLLPILVLIFVLPSTNLALTLGHLSGKGPALTFARLAPVATGLGWALVWLIGERLYVLSLNAAQTLYYVGLSLRPQLNWALECDPSFNSTWCTRLHEENVTIENGRPFPDNHWPAQEFNRLYVRRSPYSDNTSLLQPLSWYFGDEESVAFEFARPSFLLVGCHVLVWTSVFYILHRFGEKIGWFLLRICLLVPLVLFVVLLAGLSVSTFSFSASNSTVNVNRSGEVERGTIKTYPYSYRTDLHGIFRASIDVVDYSNAFTGLLMFIVSRNRSNTIAMNTLILAALQMIAPILLGILRLGCRGHLAEIQPAYVSHPGTDEVFSFDTFPACVADARFGPLWAVMYYLGNFLFASLGPMIVYLLFIQRSILEQFVELESVGHVVLALLSAVFCFFGLLLFLPTGTALVSLIEFLSETPIAQILLLFVVLFVYGWEHLLRDIRFMCDLTNGPKSWIEALFGPTSLIYTVLLFTAVPALLAAKFVSVCDLISGGDLSRHVDFGLRFLSPITLVNHLIGYGLFLAPMIIIVALMNVVAFRLIHVNKMPFIALFQPSSEWRMHSRLDQTNTGVSAPLANRLFMSLCSVSHRTALFGILIWEVMVGMVLLFLLLRTFFGEEVSNCRLVLLFVLATTHVVALLELWWTLKKWDITSRLNIYIAVVTLEMAFFNGYMYFLAFDHSWGVDWSPLLALLLNTILRGMTVIVAIAVRWNITELTQPASRLHDDSQVYRTQTEAEMEEAFDEDDLPIIYEQTNRQSPLS